MQLMIVFCIRNLASNDRILITARFYFCNTSSFGQSDWVDLISSISPDSAMGNEEPGSSICFTLSTDTCEQPALQNSVAMVIVTCSNCSDRHRIVLSDWMFLCVKHFPLRTFGKAVHNSLGNYSNLQTFNYIGKLLNFPISCYLVMQLALDSS